MPFCIDLACVTYDDHVMWPMVAQHWIGFLQFGQSTYLHVPNLHLWCWCNSTKTVS